MLTTHRPHQALGKPRAKQRGVTLLITLIVLVAMTLAAIAMVRSVDTTNIIAGNLAFQQAATHSADLGTEIALQWLERNRSGITLQSNNLANDPTLSSGYIAFRSDPAANQSWDAFWQASLDGSKARVSFTGGVPNPAGTAPAGAQWIDSAGNQVEYVIQRMCGNALGGDPISPATLCSVVPATTVLTLTDSGDAGATRLTVSGQVYYRITTRVSGPRNTVSYVQSIVAL